MVQIITFEDEHVYRLFPVTLGRPAYAVLCASYRLIDWIEKLGARPQALVRDYIRDVQIADFPSIEPISVGRTAGSTLWINARLVPARATYRALRAMRDRGEPCVARGGKSIAAAMLPASAPPLPADLSVSSIDQYFEQCGIKDLPALDVDLPLLKYPHELIQYNQETLVDNLEYRLKKGNYREVVEGVFLPPRGHGSVNTW